MKLNSTPRVNVDAETARWYRQIADQVNSLSEGQMRATYNASTSVPTVGTWSVGDFMKNKTPAEAGTAGNKYVVIGWVCTVAGTPGTWLQCRFLTGN